ncbi:MAG: Holliday junction resolvase RuvX [Oscillospiraceae bacterium]|nr:Holliday junction resolvase RuvX [Oscillospiraceae bacterium]
MKIMAVDFGDSRTGLACCDKTEFLASPLGIIEEKNFAKVAEKIAHAVMEYDAKMIVVGLPRNMDGSEGARAEKCRKLAKWLTNMLPEIPVEMWDERSTTVTAASILSDNAVYGKKRKEVLDAVAAQVILESFLAYRRNQQKQD